MRLSCPECSVSFECHGAPAEAVCPHCGGVVAAAGAASATTRETPPGTVAASVDCPVCGRELPLTAAPSQRVECPECGTSFIPAKLQQAHRRRTPDLSEGHMLGEYRLRERLGAGGMGIVYKAVHSVLGREAALKVLSPAYARDPEYRERFLREARLASALDHPGIVKVFEASFDEDILYMAMEYVPGRTLEDMVEDQGRLDPAEAARIVLSACDALQAAHAAGILHRDIKPGNVIVSDLGEIKLTDFGIACRIEASTVLTKPGAIIGTPGYIAPEQFEGGELGPPSDIYSLGATFYLLLTGEPPYADEDPVSIFLRRRWEQVPPARELVPEVPQALSDIVAKMLAKSPPQRYPSCQAVARDLGAFLDGKEVNVDVPSTEVPRQELPFGVVALREKLVTEDELLRCVRIQERLRDSGGEVPPMGRIMVQQGLISPRKMSMVLGLQRASATNRCPVCGRTLGPGRAASERYLCPVCSAKKEEAPPRIDVESRRSSIAVTVAGELLDFEDTEKLDTILEGAAHRAEDTVILDICGLRTVSADVGGDIGGWAEALQGQGKRFKVLCSPKAWAVFDRVGLTGMMTIEQVSTFRPADCDVVDSEARFLCRCGEKVSVPVGPEGRKSTCPRCGVRLLLPEQLLQEAARGRTEGAAAREEREEREERRSSEPAAGQGADKRRSAETEDLTDQVRAAGAGPRNLEVRPAGSGVAGPARLAWARTLTKSCRRFLAKIAKRPGSKPGSGVTISWWRLLVIALVVLAVLALAAAALTKALLPRPG